MIEIVWNFIITACVAVLGSCLGYKLHIPAGTLIGAMIFAAAFQVVSGEAYMPIGLKFYTQAATGMYIGAKICREDLSGLREKAKPTFILMAVMLIFSIGAGLLIHSVSDLSIATALFSMAPAGVSDMALAAMDFDAEPSVIALMQTVRIIFILCLIPSIIRLLDRSLQNRMERPHGHQKQKASQTNSQNSWQNLILTLGVGLLCGYAGKVLNVPGGTITFSMIGCAVLNLCFGRGCMPLWVRQFIQIFAGALIGCTVYREQIEQLQSMLGVVLLGAIGFLLMDLIAAALIVKFTTMDLLTALFACAPGGLTDMTLIAENMGGDSLKVAEMHTMRLIAVIAIYPTVVSHLL